MKLRAPLLITLVVAVLSLLAVASVVGYQREAAAARTAAREQIATVAQFKAALLANWHRERLDDAVGIGQDELFVRAVRRYLASGDRVALDEARASISPSVREGKYHALVVVEPGGRVVLTVGAVSPLAPNAVEHVAEVMRTRRPYLAPVIVENDEPISLDLYAPIIESAARDAAAVLVMRINPNDFLVPLARLWPTASPSAATLLVERSDREVVFALPPRQRVNSAPVPIDSGMPAAMAARGLETFFDGVDWRGVPTLAAIQQVPGTRWGLVAKIDASEVDAPLRSRAALLGVSVAALFVAAVAAVLWLVGRDQNALYRRMFEEAEARQEAARQALRLNQLLEMRSRISQAILQVHNRAALFEQACHAAVESGGFTLALVLDMDYQARELVLTAWQGAKPPGLDVGQRFATDGASGEGPTARALQSGTVHLANDVEEFAAPLRAMARAIGLTAVAAVPVPEGDVVTAVFNVYSSRPEFFDSRTARVLAEIGADLGFALQGIEAEQRLRDAEARFRALFEAAPFAAWAVDQRTGRILAANGTASRQYGYSLEEFLALPASAIFGPEDLQQTVGLGSTSSLPLATRHRRKDGTLIDVELFCRTIDVDGRSAWVVAAADVTERKQLEEQFRQAHRMEAVGRLAGGIAHDFNNLLTAITGFATLTLNDMPESDTHRKHIDQIRRAAERAASLTRQLLAFSRRQVLQLQPVDLRTSITDMGRMLQRLIGEDIRLELRLADATTVVETDPSQMELVLLNLAVNARDAMPRGGTLTISTARVRVEGASGGATRHGLPARPGDYVVLSVRDTGVGMPPYVVERIFEPFFTTKPTGQGTGLGLSTVHGIVMQSGGHISVASAPGEGTTFDIYLPAADAPTQAPAAPPPVEAGAGHETVLLVEDDSGVRELARDVLERGGYRVIEAPDAQAAIEQHASSSRHIDLLLSDIVMPGMNGIDLAQQLEALQPDLRVLLMSGYPDDALERHGLTARPVHFLQKPFTPGVLLARVRGVLDSASSQPG
ncbi:MAG: ATP-binding protein [Acidobacteriota bacterium]